MKITTNNATVPQRLSTPAKPKAEKEIPGYTGPTDGLSHYDPKAAAWIRPINKAIVGAWLHTDVKGKENIPESGAHMLCFNHSAYADAPLVQSLTDRDYRFMAAKEQFTGIVGKAMTALGSVPVDRGGASMKPVEVFVDLLNEGKGVAIAPEGRIHSDGKIHEFKGGPAMMALRSKCETLVPVVIHYEDHKLTKTERVATYLTAGAVVAGGLAAAAMGGPILRAAAGVITGALSGAAAGAGVGFVRSDAKDIKDKIGDAAGAAGWGALIGAAGGGIGGAVLGNHAMYLAAPLSVGAGAVGLVAAKAFNERKDARVVVGEGIPVEPYRQMGNNKEAREKLTSDLRDRMIQIKTELEGESATH